jgi:hypothetical protein
VCAMVRAPTPHEEDRRRICCERKTLTAERVEHVNRIKGCSSPTAFLIMSLYCARDGNGLKNSGPVMVVLYLSI